MALWVASYNVHRCIGRDGVTSCQRIATVLNGLRADVVALQEVAYDPATLGKGLGLMARAIGATAIPGPTLVERKGWYGNVILSRIAPADFRRLDISRPGREPRGAVEITVVKDNRKVRIVATHLGLRPAERRHQVKHLLRWLAHRDADTTILMGDFNDWFRWSRPLRWLARRFGHPPAPASYPSHHPVLALDRIWVAPADQLTLVKAHRAPPAAIASDHLPLVARVKI
ncbi:MAG: endonuclease/exonuclease/phosphatase family protein [Desulfatitalea sp.]|nr:endonuclease/exonuclease/phosphatase family protein [Desulfatitalea sp.]